MLKMLAGDFAPDSGVISREVRMGFYVKISILSKEELFEKHMKLYDIKIVEKLERNHQLVTRTDYESDEYSQIIEDLSDYTHRLNYEVIM
jgi:ATP-binding cassette subfamily F protein 3